MTSPPKPVILAILDGWGHRPESQDNAIAAAATPNWGYFLANFPHGLINASELHVGLPHGQMGNSEVGHMNIGSGRVVMQDLPRIDTAIENGSLAKHPALQSLIRTLEASGKTCHLLGLASDGGVHSHQAHLAALANIIASAGVKVRLHLFLDGRDTPPQSALAYVEWIEQQIAALPDCRIATLGGRYYGMDRDKRWERVEPAYKAIAGADAPRATDALGAIRTSYANNKSDEFMQPVIVGDYAGMQDGDGLVMGNFRADRVREILSALLDPNFDGFARGKKVKFAQSLGMAEYSAKLNDFMTTLFPPEKLTHILGEVVAEAGLKQLRIAETEKYAHVTFFFNGGREQEFPGEERILVPSPKVATYDLQPEMSAGEVTDKLVDAIRADRFDLIVVNYANTDMVGHTGDLDAARRAVEAVDSCLGRLWVEVEKRGGAMLITADHGNAEMMFDHETKQAHTAHTLNLVPALLLSPSLRGKQFDIAEGKLADVAPTILALMQLPQPAEMTGRSLLPREAFA